MQVANNPLVASIFESIFDLQNRLNISDDYLLRVHREPAEDDIQNKTLERLLDAWIKARDDLITWYLKQTIVELNVTISLLTAKIKFVECRLGMCDSLDVHQACSLSLVNFCNILANMTILSAQPSERKTMHQISHEVDVPIWLSHYRNQICHVPSESPSITILAPLVVKSLDYLKESFWLKVLNQDIFSTERCKKLIRMIVSNTHVVSINQNITLKPDLKFGKKRMKLVENERDLSFKAIKSLRRLSMKSPDHVTDMITDYVVKYRPNDNSKNCALLIEQVILARRLERFALRLVSKATVPNPDKKTLLWLLRTVDVICSRSKDELKQSLNKIGLNSSVKMNRLSVIPLLKCCHLAFRVTKVDHDIVVKLMAKLCQKMRSFLGKDRTKLLMRLTRIARRKNE